MGIDLAPFLVVVALITVSPGPDTVLVVNRAAASGRRAGVLTALGSASGLVLWGIAAAFGVAAVVQASATAFTALKLVGAAYLIYLGVRLLLARDELASSVVPGTPTRAGTLFGQGLATNLLNPKAAGFFTALMPQFVPEEGVLAATLVMALIAASASLVGLSLYAAAAARAGALLRRPRPRRVLSRLTGTVLVGFGVRLAFERR